MTRINFTKMVASGNDFVVIDSLPRYKNSELKKLAQQICDRKFGLGADGLLILGKSRVADVKMRIFNADGSEAEMCGNGARCSALYTSLRHKAQVKRLTIETKAGIIESEVKNRKVKIRLTEPRGVKLDIPIKVNDRVLRVNFINTGVPHTVIFSAGLDKIDVANLGRQIRNHKRFAPAGTNVNFIEVLAKDEIKIRTYERGVEGETLACGTGSVASALIFALKSPVKDRVNIQTRGGDTLRVYFKKTGNHFKEVWLEGKTQIVAKGVYYV